MIIDAWAQHPTLRHLQDPVFDSLRRWTRQQAPTEEIPVAATVAAMDRAGVDHALISAWYAPGKVMISNGEVAESASRPTRPGVTRPQRLNTSRGTAGPVCCSSAIEVFGSLSNDPNVVESTGISREREAQLLNCVDNALGLFR
jgi:hypothetical protein